MLIGVVAKIVNSLILFLGFTRWALHYLLDHTRLELFLFHDRFLFDDLFLFHDELFSLSLRSGCLFLAASEQIVEVINSLRCLFWRKQIVERIGLRSAWCRLRSR